MKILTILGARPQFVKAAVVSRSIASLNKIRKDAIKEVIVHTGQHYDKNMSFLFFKEMCIPGPDYNLEICNSSHGAMTGKMLEKVEDVLLLEKPDIVLVYGDTNSTLAGALAASKLHIEIAHVEAGLRSYNMRMPEEINRILTDRISHYLFCPTETAVMNLSKEGIANNPQNLSEPPIVQNVGDIMYDAALFYQKTAKPTGSVAKLINEFQDGFYLATVHRAENTDDCLRMKSIASAFRSVSKEAPIVLPLHPRTKKLIHKYKLNFSGVRVIDPVGYFDMISLLQNCMAVFTDSGGLQKEAYFFKKPCITLREETEWVELVEHGYNTLVGAEEDQIIYAARNLHALHHDYSESLYGNGDAGDKIVQILTNSAR
jgi:UDP-GlcNAc3NAcA epimerase